MAFVRSLCAMIFSLSLVGAALVGSPCSSQSLDDLPADLPNRAAEDDKVKDLPSPSEAHPQYDWEHTAAAQVWSGFAMHYKRRSPVENGVKGHGFIKGRVQIDESVRRGKPMNMGVGEDASVDGRTVRDSSEIDSAVIAGVNSAGTVRMNRTLGGSTALTMPAFSRDNETDQDDMYIMGVNTAGTARYRAVAPVSWECPRVVLDPAEVEVLELSASADSALVRFKDFRRWWHYNSNLAHGFPELAQNQDSFSQGIWVPITDGLKFYPRIPVRCNKNFLLLRSPDGVRDKFIAPTPLERPLEDRDAGTAEGSIDSRAPSSRENLPSAWY